MIVNVVGSGKEVSKFQGSEVEAKRSRETGTVAVNTNTTKGNSALHMARPAQSVTS